MAKTRTIYFLLSVTVSVRTGESEVSDAVNAALDETPDHNLDWGEWEVSPAVVIGATKA